MFFLAFFELSDQQMQKIIKEKLLLICEAYEKIEEKHQKNNNECIEVQNSINSFFFSLCINEFLFKVDLQLYREKCYHFFDFLNFLGKNIKKTHFDSINQTVSFTNLMKFLLDLFEKLPIFEKNQGESDFLLQGLFKIFHILLNFSPSLKEELLKNGHFLKELSYKCLFEMPTGKNN